MNEIKRKNGIQVSRLEWCKRTLLEWQLSWNYVLWFLWLHLWKLDKQWDSFSHLPFSDLPAVRISSIFSYCSAPQSESCNFNLNGYLLCDSSCIKCILSPFHGTYSWCREQMAEAKVISLYGSFKIKVTDVGAMTYNWYRPFILFLLKSFDGF